MFKKSKEEATLLGGLLGLVLHIVLSHPLMALALLASLIVRVRRALIEMTRRLFESFADSPLGAHGSFPHFVLLGLAGALIIFLSCYLAQRWLEGRARSNRRVHPRAPLTLTDLPSTRALHAYQELQGYRKMLLGVETKKVA